MTTDMTTNYEIREDPSAPRPEARWRMSGKNSHLAFYGTEADAIYAAMRQPGAGGGDFMRAADEDIRQANAEEARSAAAGLLPLDWSQSVLTDPWGDAEREAGE